MDRKTLYNLLDKTYDNQEILKLCFLNPKFEKLHDNIEELANKDKKIIELIKYCEKNSLTDNLLSIIKKDYPKHYKRYSKTQVKTEHTLIKALKNIPIYWDKQIIEEYPKSSIKTFLVFSEENYEKGINLFWTNHLFKNEAKNIVETYTFAKSNDFPNIKELLCVLLGNDKMISEMTEEELLHSNTFDKIAEKLIQILRTKNIRFVIDTCIGLLKKDEDEINFFEDIWKPIATRIEKSNPSNTIELLLIQTGAKLKPKHIFTQNIDKSLSDKIPFLITYNGFKNKINQEIDLENLKNWILNEDNDDDGVIASKKTIHNKKFKNVFKNQEAIYLESCECGNIEKLFEKIVNDFGFTLDTTKKEQGKIIWKLRKIKYTTQAQP